jgi:hypothetical protein
MVNKQVITSSSQKEREKKVLARRRRKNPMLQVEDEMDSRYRHDEMIEELLDLDDEFDYHDIKEEKKEEDLHSSDRAGQNANEFGAFDFSAPDEIQESEWHDFCNSCTEEELAGIIESLKDKEEEKASEPSQVEDIENDNVTAILQIIKKGDDDYGNAQTKYNADVNTMLTFIGNTAQSAAAV